MEDFPNLDLQEKTVVTAGLPLPQLSPTSLPSHRPPPTQVPPTHHCFSHDCRHCLLPKPQKLGLSFCLATDSNAKLFHLASQTRCQHTVSTALELFTIRETLVTSLRSPDPSTAEATGNQQHILQVPGLSLCCYNCLPGT